jgi:hypothetical protein
VIRLKYARVWARKYPLRALLPCPSARIVRRCGVHGTEASTHPESRPRGVRQGPACVRTRCPPLGTHRRARSRRPRRDAETAPARGRRPTRACAAGAMAGAGSGPHLSGPLRRVGGEPSLHPWPRARRKRLAGGVPRSDVMCVTQQANRAAGRSPPAGRRPRLFVRLKPRSGAPTWARPARAGTLERRCEQPA